MKRLFLALFALLLPTQLLAAPQAVASADPRATAAGQAMLDQGGSAADAAIAMMLALTVVEPQSSGIGGGGFILYHDGKTGKLATTDGREKAPAAATPDRFLGPNGQPLSFRQAFPGGRSVGVPGNIALAARAHERWGKLPWAALFQPAIKLAESYEVAPRQATFLKLVAPLWADFPAARALYWQDGRPKVAGEIVRNPELAAVFREIAAGGPQAFYRGKTAQAIVDATRLSKVAPGDMTLADLAAYRAKDRDAVCAPYRQYRVCGMGPPSGGATTVLQMLGLLERFDMKALGKDSPVAWHLIGEAMQLAYADREKYLGDADFVRVPVAGLLDRDYLRQRSALISEGTALGSYSAGDPPGAQARTAGISSEVAGTTHFVAADKTGNVATMTSTVEGPFGSQLVARGFVLNNELTDFTFTPVKDGAPVANAVAGGKRPLSSMSPTMVYDRQGRVVLALGSAGGKQIIMHVLRSLVGVLDWGLSAQDALALPNIYFGGQALLVEQGTPLAAMQQRLAALGQTVVSAPLTSKLTAIERTPQGWRAALDPHIARTVTSE